MIWAENASIAAASFKSCEQPASYRGRKIFSTPRRATNPTVRPPRAHQQHGPRTRAERPPHSCVDSSTSTTLYTLLHSGWWSIYDTRRLLYPCMHTLPTHRPTRARPTFSASSAVFVMNENASLKSLNKNLRSIASRSGTCTGGGHLQITHMATRSGHRGSPCAREEEWTQFPCALLL